MKRIRWVALAGGVAVVVSTMVASAGAQSSTADSPKATEVGVTPTEIHVAVVADVDNSIAPNLFKASVDAVRGAAKYLNSKEGGGGLAGRKVVVDFYDSQLNPSTTRNGEIKACENDVAMVGTSAVFLTSVDEMRNCKDSTGAATGLPDIPFVSTALAQQCSDQSFPVTPPQVVCSTKDEHPQTFQANVGRGRYYEKVYGNNKLHGIYIFNTDSKSAHDSSVASLGGLRDIGIESDGDFDRPGAALQSAFTDIVQAMKNKGSNYGTCTGPYTCTVNLRKEAALQGVTAKVWDCSVQCYDRQFLAAAGQDAEKEYVDTLFLPFYSKADQKAVPMLANFVKYTGTDKVASYGAYAWSAMMAFRDAVNGAVKAGGVNGVTRKAVLEQLTKIHNFSADGMLAPIDLAARKISQCTVTMQVKNGDFVRVNPTAPGTFACAKQNVIYRKLDLINHS